ncbi:hypothetical protein [Lacipirellula limnantheis]|uniref:Uncharacterized protein n=1 Tax=Lacipirellula limnantheis TaxID=2528024 RepID=A0A517U2P0_9BACT|nr:hypothetical protein [Lacipirellula limnantheis]QDT74891.1 hypothetical protein I41_40950 [Lacipirellula limnantheis]
MRVQRFLLTFAAIACVASIGCVGGKAAYNLPPAQRLLEPGPGVGGPGPGVIQPAGAMMPMGPMGPGGGPMDGGYCGGGGPIAPCMALGAGGTSQIAFLGVEGAEVAWDVSGVCMFDSTPLVMPGRQNFQQGAIYRLKLTNIPDRAGVELYPTLEVAPVTPRTDAYLSHSPIPVQFTDEDLDQVLAGNFVTKVIYLPDPEFQDLALAGVETLVSTRLDPGVDPIAEADRRGSILAILRIGNLDLQLPGQMLAMNGGVENADYQEGGVNPAQCMTCPTGQGGGYGGPQGMPTSAFAPQIAPPNYISGVNGPQWGMPSVGTPIGLPGPPHIPLGHQAGLKEHTMVNRTRVLMPPPVAKMKMTVKQRPGMNYPRPVNHVKVSETNRAPFRLFGGTLPGAVPSAIHRLGAHKHAAGEPCNDQCYEGESSGEYSSGEYEGAVEGPYEGQVIEQ